MRTVAFACAVAIATAARGNTFASVLGHIMDRAKDSAEPGSMSSYLTSILVETYKQASAMSMNTKKQMRLKGKKHTRTVQPSLYDSSHSYFPDMSYYAVVPESLTNVPPQSSASWSSACLTSNTATASAIVGNSLSLTIASTGLNSSAPLCDDFYLLATLDQIQLLEITAEGSQTVNFTISNTQWAQTYGVRVFRFIHDPLTTIGDLLDTLSLFVPSLTSSPPDVGSQQRNLQFMQNYMNITMEPRSAGLIDFDTSVVNSGDMFVVCRLDGLATMEMWGTGAHSSHIVMGMRFGDNDTLYIVESTDKGADWPLPNIQMNRWEDWVPMAIQAGYMVVHLPLSPAIRANFNVSMAQEFIYNTLGLPYGYHNFVNTFFDTTNGNLPWPASWQFVEVVVAQIEKLDRNLSDSIFTDALNMRLGTSGLSFGEALNLGHSRNNWTFGDMLAIPEHDGWVYSDGLSMVCDVYWCAIHKAGGSFGELADQIQCNEFHNLDVYRLNFFDFSTPRQPACVAADPDLPYCQIMGNYRLALPFVNSMEPYPGMNQNCTALPLDYTRYPAQC